MPRKDRPKKIKIHMDQFDDEYLIELIQNSTSYFNMFNELKLTYPSKKETWAANVKRIKSLGVSLKHFNRVVTDLDKEEIEAAIAVSGSYTALAAELGFKFAAWSDGVRKERLLNRLEELGIPPLDYEDAKSPEEWITARKEWFDAVKEEGTYLEDLINSSTSFTEVGEHLGFSVRKKRILDELVGLVNGLNIPLTHFQRSPYQIPYEELINAIGNSTTYAEMGNLLGFKRKTVTWGEGRANLLARLEELGIPLPPFDSVYIHPTRIQGRRKKFSDMLSPTAITRYIFETRPHECEICGRSRHDDDYLPIEMHHIDRDRANNTEENLILLCCNCHEHQHQRGKATSHTKRRANFVFSELKTSRSRRLFLIEKHGHTCQRCNRYAWEGDYLPLHAHHIDENRHNNVEANFELVCANCHNIRHELGAPIEIKVERRFVTSLKQYEKRSKG